MAEYVIQGETLTDIADKTRSLLGLTEKLGPDAMASNLGTAVDECDSQAALIAQIKDALEGKAVGGGAGKGFVVKTGTTTSPTIDTGLSDVEQFFIYKESLTATGLIHLHYSKNGTSRMYASAWSTNSYGSKTITNGTDGVNVNGGTLTISAAQAAQGALTSRVTYKWIAVGTE